MCKFYALSITLLFICGTLSAKVITVSNNLNSPGQYNNLQTAIDAALSADTLLVSGSPTTYGNITINNKTLTLIGQGYDPRKDVAFASTVGQVSLNSGSTGSIIVGFIVTGNINPAVGVNNVTVKRCDSRNVILVNGNGWSITDNIISNGYIYIAGVANTLIKNNIFTNVNTYAIYGPIAAASNLLITNNDFTYTSSTNLIRVNNAVISNNIFYHKSNNAVNINLLTNSTNCLVSNNITFNNTNANPFNIGSDNITGSGNLINVNPLFVSYALSATSVSRTDNLQLQAGSRQRMQAQMVKISVHMEVLHQCNTH